MKKDKSITIRLSLEELKEIQRIANIVDRPYQSIIRAGGVLYAQKLEEEHKKFIDIKRYAKEKRNN